MALKGDLASVDLAQVFQMLSLNQKVGILGIDATRASRALHFDARGVTMLYDEPILHERVLMQAERRGLISFDSLEEAREDSKRSGRTVLEALAAGGFAADEELADMIRGELEEDIYDVFFWRHAQFEFYENATSLPTSGSTIDERFYFSVDSVIMEAARRIDEWSFINQRVQSGDEVFRACNVDDSELKNVDALVFQLSDGLRNIRRLIELTGLPRFQVFKTVAVLNESGYIERVPDDELWDAARRCVELKRLEDAVDLFELAIASGADGTAIRGETAAVYESLDEYAKAAVHLKRVATAHVEAGELKAAVQKLQHIVKMLPTDLDARETLVSLTVGVPEAQRDGFDPATYGKQLADFYMEIGEIERVRTILEQLLRDAPNDMALKKRLINVHTRAGDTRRVVELYESIANDLVAAREPIEAIKYLQKILMIDRTRRDISDRVRTLYEADERRRSRRRRLIALGALLLLLAGLAGLWYVYEGYARDRMSVVEKEVRKLASEQNFDSAIAALDAFIENYPLTMVAREATGEKARIESMRKAHQDALNALERRREMAREDVRKRYRLAWADYEDHARNHRLDRALEAIKEVQRLVEEAGASQDEKWSRDVGVEANRFELERFMSEASRLDREAWAKLEAGDWMAARTHWLELLHDYYMSKHAKTVRLPVQLRSRPLGAEIWSGGKPLTAPDGDLTLTTPSVVLCRPGVTESFELRLQGFATATLEVEANHTETVEPTLRVVPTRVFEFSTPVRAPVAVGRGLIAAGLRNGRIVVAHAESGVTQTEQQLEGLDEVRGRATFFVDRFFYMTSEGYLASRRTASGRLLWRERLPGLPTHDPVLHSGRILIADDQGRLHVYEPNTGKRLWTLGLGGNVAGAPALASDLVYYGLREGRIIAVDLGARRIVSRSEDLPSGVATGLLLSETGFIYGDDRGVVIARTRLRGGDGWQWDSGRSLGSDDIVLVGGELFARGEDSRIVKLDAVDGRVLGEIEFESPISSGPFVSGRSLYVVLRVTKPRRRSTDLLRAFDRASLELAWEYEDGGRFVAPPTCDEHSLYLPDSNGKVLRFR